MARRSCLRRRDYKVYFVLLSNKAHLGHEALEATLCATAGAHRHTQTNHTIPFAYAHVRQSTECYSGSIAAWKNPLNERNLVGFQHSILAAWRCSPARSRRGQGRGHQPMTTTTTPVYIDIHAHTDTNTDTNIRGEGRARGEARGDVTAAAFGVGRSTHFPVHKVLL